MMFSILQDAPLSKKPSPLVLKDFVEACPPSRLAPLPNIPRLERGQRPGPQGLWRLIIAGGCALLLSGCFGSLGEIDRKLAEGELAETALTKIAEDKRPVKISTNPLALPDAMRLAILTSPRIQSSSFDLAVAGNAVLIERSAYFPEIYYQLSPSGDETILASAEAGLRYTLYDFGARAARSNAALWERRGASHTIIQLIDEVSMETVRAYVDLAAAEENTKIAKALLSDLQEESERVTARVASGAANESELQSVNVAIIRAEANQIEAKAQLDSARVRLRTHTGVAFGGVSSLAALEGKIPAKVAALDVEKSPQVLYRKAEQMAAEQNLLAVKAGRLPKIGLRAGVSSKVTEGGDFGKAGVTLGPEIGGNLSLSGGRKLEVRNAELAVNVAISNVAVAKREVGLAEQNARLNLQALTQNFALRKNVLSASEELTRLRRVEYEAESASISDIIDAIEAEAAARSALVSTQAALLVTRIELLLTTGQLQSLYFFGKDVRFDRTASAAGSAKAKK